MPCRCKSQMNFADANYLYQNKRRCPFSHPPMTLPEIAPEEPDKCTDTDTSCCCEQDHDTTECCESKQECTCCQCCSCVDRCCYEPVVIPCKPIDCRPVERQLEYRVCCDPNGNCCRYPCCCRNRFWPNFAHPRWLCCKDLYNVD